ncbi:MerR family DNA-binding protein [bacterium]|nr:MerR family DNA-binding protein [bacterium]
MTTHSGSLSIGQLAKRAGVDVETVRYSAREGLLVEPQRRQSGYRQYRNDTVGRLLFIRRAKELGFTLKEISELLSLRIDEDKTCADVRQQAEAKLVDIEERIRSLQRMKRALVKLTRQCQGSSPTSECPILESLDRKETN